MLFITPLSTSFSLNHFPPLLLFSLLLSYLSLPFSSWILQCERSWTAEHVCRWEWVQGPPSILKSKSQCTLRYFLRWVGCSLPPGKDREKLSLLCILFPTKNSLFFTLYVIVCSFIGIVFSLLPLPSSLPFPPFFFSSSILFLFFSFLLIFSCSLLTINWHYLCLIHPFFTLFSR